MIRSEYKTDTRRAVTDFLKSHSDRHFTVGEIIDGLGEAEEKISKSTVYRCISHLCDKGIVRRFEIPGEHSFAYQYCYSSEACSNHFHLKCMKCGKLIHIECNYLSKAKEHISAEHNFLIENEGVIGGICADCTKKCENKRDIRCHCHGEVGI